MTLFSSVKNKLFLLLISILFIYLFVGPFVISSFDQDHSLFRTNIPINTLPSVELFGAEAIYVWLCHEQNTISGNNSEIQWPTSTQPDVLIEKIDAVYRNRLSEIDPVSVRYNRMPSSDILKALYWWWSPYEMLQTNYDKIPIKVFEDCSRWSGERVLKQARDEGLKRIYLAHFNFHLGPVWNQKSEHENSLLIASGVQYYTWKGDGVISELYPPIAIPIHSPHLENDLLTWVRSKLSNI